jgi:hypothetical protein
MTTEVELKEIRSLLMELNKKVEGMNKLLEKSLCPMRLKLQMYMKTLRKTRNCN